MLVQVSNRTMPMSSKTAVPQTAKKITICLMVQYGPSYTTNGNRTSTPTKSSKLLCSTTQLIKVHTQCSKKTWGPKSLAVLVIIQNILCLISRTSSMRVRNQCLCFFVTICERCKQQDYKTFRQFSYGLTSETNGMWDRSGSVKYAVQYCIVQLFDEILEFH